MVEGFFDDLLYCRLCGTFKRANIMYHQTKKDSNGFVIWWELEADPRVFERDTRMITQNGHGREEKYNI